MEPTYELYTYLKMYYLDSNIPFYLYHNGKVLFSMPEQNVLTCPPEKYVRKLQAVTGHVSHITTDYGISYGGLRMNKYTDSYLVLGPVCDIPFSDTELHYLYMDYVVPMEEREHFRSFLHRIPPTALSTLLTKLFFLNYCLNLEEMTLTDYLPQDMDGVQEKDGRLYEKKPDTLHNKSYEMENLITNCVRTGNPEGLKAITLNTNTLNIGIIGPTALRQLKNNLIITVTLATRAAIDGGLDYDTAYQMSDTFIQRAERSSSPDELNHMFMDVNYQFAMKVYEHRTPLSSNDIMTKAIRYIQQNINQPIQVDDVASYVGFSRSYFSTMFKKELGFSVSAFILRCRLEESRRLLKYTSRSLNDISNYLCFSSQSHFQTAFKKQYKLTPKEYRQSGSSVRRKA